MGLLIDFVRVLPLDKTRYIEAPFLLDTGAVFTIVSRRVATNVGLVLGTRYDAPVYGGLGKVPGHWSTAFIELVDSRVGVTLNVFVPDSKKPGSVLGMDYLKLTNTVIRIGAKTYRFGPTWPNPEPGFLPDIRDEDLKRIEEHVKKQTR